MGAQDVLDLIERKENLPVLPQLFYRIVEKASTPETSVSELSRLILEDQVLTGRVIRMANSAYYATEEKISTVTRAIMVLGFFTLKSFIIAITVGDSLNNDAFKGELFETVWVHGLACSLSANSLAQKLAFEHPEEAMIAGLVHDSGKLFLDHHFPKEYKKVAQMIQQGKDILAAERSVFGLTHVDVGEKIALRWCLPETLIDAIRNHHEFSESTKNLSLSDIIYVAGLFASKAIPEEWKDRIQRIYPDHSTEREIKKTCSNLKLSEKDVREIIQTTKENIYRVAEDLNLEFLKPSGQKGDDPSAELFRLNREVEEKERQLAMINEIGAFAMENPKPEELIQVVVEAVHRGIGFDRTLLFLRNPTGDEVNGRLGLGYDVPPFLKKITVSMKSDGLMGKAMQERSTFNVVDEESPSDGALPSLEVPSLAEIKAFALVPFLAGTEVVGLVMVDNTFTGKAIGDREVDLIRTFLTLAGGYLARYVSRGEG